MCGPVAGDATAAVQAAVNAAIANCWKLRIPMMSAPYVLSSPIEVTGNVFSLEGDGPPIASMFQLAKPNMNGFDFSGFNGRLMVKNVGFSGAPNPIAGAALYFGGATASASQSLLDNILTLGCYEGIAGSGLGNGSNVTNCSLTAKYPLSLGTFGDSGVFGSTLLPTAGGFGATFYGDPGGLRFGFNKINGQNYVAGLSIIVQQSDGDILIASNSIEGFGTGNYGIIVSAGPNTPFSNFEISNNEIAGSGCPFSLTSGGPFKMFALVGNRCQAGGGAPAINFNSGSGIALTANTCSGNIVIAPGCAGAAACNVFDTGGFVNNAPVTFKVS